MKRNSYLESIVKNPKFEKEDSFDYGKVLTSVDEVRSGRQSITKYLFKFKEGYIPDVTSKHIHMHGAYDAHKYMIAVGQIGTDSLSPKTISPIISTLKKAFDELDVQFCHISIPLRTDIVHEEQFAKLIYPTAAEYFLNKARAVLPIHSMVFALDTKESIGVAGEFPLFSAHVDTSYTAVHEIGHLLGLDDGYEQYYHQSELPGTELFTHLSTLPNHIKNAYKLVQPDIYRTGNMYKGRAVYRFDAESVMADKHDVKETLKAGFPIFTPMQVHLMNEYIKKNK